MSINQYLSSDIPETLWWSTQQEPTMEPSPKTLLSPLNRHQPPPSATPLYPTFNFNIVHQETHTEFLPSPELDNPTNYTKDQEQEAPKEPMFEKPLTPSDVGKLNRLVIPKQHAEKYFPLGSGNGNGNGTDSSIEKGLLLNFEDEIGKTWRFRYSYWNSSQSYVLTKGWSRFVKEKRLDAGDVVMFERHRLDRDRLFVGWRRRAVAVPTSTQDGGGVGFVGHDQLQGACRVAVAPGGGGGNISGWTRVFFNAQQAYPSHPGSGNVNGSCIPYQPDCLHAGSNVQYNGQTTASGNLMKRSVRLFGVNLECQADDSPEQQQVRPGGGSPISSQGSQAQSQSQYLSPSPHLHHNHLEMNLRRDVNQMRYKYQQEQQQYHQG